MNHRPHTTAILAMTADGKISDYQNSPARFGSANDRAHLEQQVSLADGILFGAGTLRAYGTTMSVSQPELLHQRSERSQPPQPIQIVVSASGNLDPQWHFFQQSVPRWLLTLPQGAELWQNRAEFERILVVGKLEADGIDWRSALVQLQRLGLNKLAILGGGELMSSLLAVNSIDELWLTICPVIFGGEAAPTPVGGMGFLQSHGKKLELLEVKQLDGELFLHYRVQRN
ncbi:RibD family protein [Pleurocapsales cyanobacterium LEGE 10410]|nr:RibD family protein [Pleurocapsales cyanobacterium LEGE 10410]